MSSGPRVAETMGATTGSSQTGDALPGATSWRTTIRYGTATVAARPIRVPTPYSTHASGTAALSPITSAPTPRVPMPTARNAIDRQP